MTPEESGSFELEIFLAPLRNRINTPGTHLL